MDFDNKINILCHVCTNWDGTQTKMLYIFKHTFL